MNDDAVKEALRLRLSVISFLNDLRKRFPEIESYDDFQCPFVQEMARNVNYFG